MVHNEYNNGVWLLWLILGLTCVTIVLLLESYWCMYQISLCRQAELRSTPFFKTFNELGLQRALVIEIMMHLVIPYPFLNDVHWNVPSPYETPATELSHGNYNNYPHQLSNNHFF